MITFRNQKTSATPNGIQLLHQAHHQAERTSHAKDSSQASPCQLWFLAVTFPQQVAERAPAELREIAKVTMCVFTSERPQVGTVGVFKASQTQQ